MQNRAFLFADGPFALPLAALATSLFFGLAVWNGKRDTTCWAKHPLMVALFWLLVVGVWAFLHLHYRA